MSMHLLYALFYIWIIYNPFSKRIPSYIFRRASKKSVFTWIILYSLCSSLMLVVNKWAMLKLPIPALVNLIQLITCSLFVYALKIGNYAKVSIHIQLSIFFKKSSRIFCFIGFNLISFLCLCFFFKLSWSLCSFFTMRVYV